MVKQLLLLYAKILPDIKNYIFSIIKDFEGILRFSHALFKELLKFKINKKQTIKEMLYLGYHSTPIIVFTITFFTVICILESYYHVGLIIKDPSIIPGVSSVLIIKEVSTTITALIVICRICPGITSEIAIMKETEQLDALKLLGINPLSHIIIPKFIAVFFTLITISIFSCFTAFITSIITSYTHLGLSFSNFMNSFHFFITFKDFIPAILKVISYGIIIPIISCYAGLSSGTGANEIGKSATKSIVMTSVIIVFIDFLITYLFNDMNR